MSDIQSDRSPSLERSGSQSRYSANESPTTRSIIQMEDYQAEIADPMVVDYDYLQEHTPWFMDSLGDPTNAKRRGSTTVVICKVCGSKIPLVGYDLDEHYIVKCSYCKEATPIRPAPPGERYIRCVCNCLLICRDLATKVACPRLNCQRIITLNHGGGTQTTATQPPPGTCRMTCAYCMQPFIFNMRSKSVTKCPYCDRISAIKGDYRKKQQRSAVMVAVVFTVMTLIIIIGNAVVNESYEGEAVLYLILIAITAIIWIRPVVGWRVKESVVDGQL